MGLAYFLVGAFIAMLCVAAGAYQFAIVIASGLVGVLFARVARLQKQLSDVTQEQQLLSWQRDVANTARPKAPVASMPHQQVQTPPNRPTQAASSVSARASFEQQYWPTAPTEPNPQNPLAPASEVNPASPVAVPKPIAEADIGPRKPSYAPLPNPPAQTPPVAPPATPAYQTPVYQAPVQPEPGTFVLRNSASAPQPQKPPQNAPDFSSKPAYKPVEFEPAGSGLPSWLTGLLSFENWPIKLGMILLLVGLASGFRYLAAKGYFTLPMEARLIGVALIAMAALIFGYIKREEKRTFALVMQGGALGALLLTTYAALQLYKLIDQPLGFGLMLAIVATGVVLAVAQDAMLLALFSTIGGFAAPILASTGQGSHVQLFSYYLILNAGILAIALRKGWRPLNVLGAICTFGIGIGWGANYYRPEFFPTVEPFLIAFFLIYLAITVLYALRHGEGEMVLDGVLVFGVPLASFGAQAGLLAGQDEKLALSTFIASLLYGGLSFSLREKSELLSKCFAFLSISFLTISIPLYFDASATSALWAVEGAGVIWLAMRQERSAPMLLGLALQVFAYLSYLGGYLDMAAEPNYVNPRCFGATLLAISALLCAHLFNRVSHQAQHRFHSMSFLSWPFAIATLLWWAIAGAGEIVHSNLSDARFAVAIAFVAGTGTLFALLAKWLQLRALHIAVWLALSSFVFISPVIAIFDPVFADQRGIAFAAAFVFSLISLKLAAEIWLEMPLKLSHGLFVFSVALVVALFCTHGSLEWAFGWTADQIGSGSIQALQSMPFLMVFGLLVFNMRFIGFPIQEYFDDAESGWRSQMRSIWAIGIALMILFACLQIGHAAPFAYVPILNPLELSIFAGAYLLWRHARNGSENDSSTTDTLSNIRPLAIAFAFLIITTSTLRGVIHMYDPSLDNLASAFFSKTGQSALALVWSVFGCGAMLLGHARQRRSTWIAGATVMGVVLVKMLLIDRRNLGELPGIIATLGVGALLAAVGYFAPVPPAESDERANK
jgi:uncharacterized membrane protein